MCAKVHESRTLKFTLRATGIKYRKKHWEIIHEFQFIKCVNIIIIFQTESTLYISIENPGDIENTFTFTVNEGNTLVGK